MTALAEGSCGSLHLDDGLDLRPAVAGDAPTIALWMSRPHVQRWWRQDWSVERWAQQIAEQSAGEHSLPCVVSLDSEQLGYVELYRVRHDRIADYYEYDVHDWGVHVAIGEPARTGQGIGRRLLAAVAAAVLRADPRCPRVVAEPDVTNVGSVRAFAAAGFETVGEIDLPEKKAVLMMRPRST
ncbi:GNAT family N-acetyltransferase [Kribbella deserti]|uniref:Lysine N-acyltransferase MbtK n=1 Tax=Kribbella deserti TaxID=1926257 RepID=A0ABV6QNQ6_9ACTN